MSALPESGSIPLTVGVMVTSWRPDALGLLLTGLFGGGYLWARRRVPGWPAARTVAFMALGLGSLLLVSVTFIGIYSSVLFWARAVQIIVLLMIAPLGVALGAPFSLLVHALGDRGRKRLERALTSRTMRILTYPAVGSGLLLVTPWLLYFTGWYQAMLDHGSLDVLTRLVILTIGFVYFYGRLQVDPMPRRYPHLLSMVITFIEVIADAALGLVLWLEPHLVAYPHYAALHRSWGPSLRLDQIIGAGILWIGGDLAGLPFLAALLRRMHMDDAADADAIDRELDEREKALVIEQNQSENTNQPPMLRPWWEDDPELSQRLHRR